MSKSKQPPAEPPPECFVPICAIGASAGGVSALQTLFRLLPDDLDLAYVVIVHLSPDHPSAMHEILGACTKMPVHQVKDGPKLQPNCVFIIAPDSEPVPEGDNVKARPFTDPRSKRAPIDMFFRSVAAGRGDGIAVVLTGAGSDGALGVRAIKETRHDAPSLPNRHGTFRRCRYRRPDPRRMLHLHEGPRGERRPARSHPAA